MTDPIAIALIGGLPATLLALATLVRSMKNSRIAKDNDKKTDDLLQKTEQIHVLTDGNLTRVNAELTAANVRIAKLEELLRQLIPDRTSKKPPRT